MHFENSNFVPPIKGMKKTKRHVTNVTPRQPASTHPETDPDPAMKKEIYVINMKIEI